MPETRTEATAAPIQESSELREFQRQRQQGMGRPIIAAQQGRFYVVAVGKRLRRGQWRTFTDFLGDYIKNAFGNDWGNAEIAKSEAERHPVILWYQSLCHLQKAHVQVPGEIFSMPLTGGVKAYLGLAYDLYTIEHNVASSPDAAAFDRLMSRLRHKDQFLGARYEVRIGAMFIRAGFRLKWEDETDNTSTHGEFVATYPGTGREFWVECKIRQRDPKLGQDRNLGRFVSLVSDALRKETDKQRFVFVDLNTPAKPRQDEDASDWRDWAVGRLRILESSPQGETLPPALVMVTNFPDHHHPDSLVPDAGGALEGFKMDEYRMGKEIGLREAIQYREKLLEVEALLKSIPEHGEVPTTFDGQIPELADVSNRIIIGNLYEFDDGITGKIVEALMNEAKSEVFAIVELSDGSQATYTLPVSELEVSAWRRYPETFFGVMREAPNKVTDVLQLYDFFLRTYSKSSKEKLLEFMSLRNDIAELSTKSQSELAKIYSESMAGSAAITSPGLSHRPTWVRRMRPPPTRSR